ncbi:MAG: hypothetical protein JWO15_1726 [Sphingomonadales bacterium]|nr:hypothetical protein [Sphingomonadales bacterium]
MMSQPRIFVTLDVMRGIAALAVLAHHCAPLLGPWWSPGSAYLAVDLFFMLSGFVLALAYSDRLNSTMTTGQFVVERAIRIYPLFALGMLFGSLAAVLMLITGSPSWTLFQIARDTATGLFMIPSVPWDSNGVFKYNLFPLNWPAWSLFYEVVINLVFAFLPIRRWSQLLPLLIVSAIGVIGVSATYNGMDAGTHYFEIGAGLIRVTFGFFMGVALYTLHRRAPLVRALPAIIVLAVTALLLAVPMGETMRPWYDAACVLILFPVVIYLGAAIQPRGIVRRAGEKLGVASFAIYATHAGPLLIFGGLWARLSPASKGHPSPLIGLLFIAGMVLFALTLHRFFDEPLRRWLRAQRGAGRLPVG